MHLFLDGQSSGVIHLVVLLKCHGKSICQEGDQIFVLALFSHTKLVAFVMAVMGPIRVFCPFYDLTS